MTARRKSASATRNASARTSADNGLAAPQIKEPAIFREIVGYALRRAQFAIYQDYARTIGELDVRPAQFAALAIIAANPGLSQTALATMMGIDRSGAVTLIDALEGRNLAARLPSQVDRRTYAIMLTAAGQTMLAQLTERVREHDERMTAALTKAEKAQLIGMLRRLYDRPN